MQARWLLTVLFVAASLAASPKTSTRITLNVVAFDNHDQIVSDLTSQDFQVSDQGKPQRIVSFHRKGEPQAKLNNVPNAPQVAPPVVLLFDLLHDSWTSQFFRPDEDGARGVFCKPSVALAADAISDSLDLLLEGSPCTGHTTRFALPVYLGNRSPAYLAIRLLPLQSHAD